MKSVPGGATKTQIVYFSSLNFHTVVPYLELVTRNGLVVRAAGGVPWYKTTGKENKSPKAIGELIPDSAVIQIENIH